MRGDDHHLEGAVGKTGQGLEGYRRLPLTYSPHSIDATASLLPAIWLALAQAG
jgi:hypothetical protein